MSIVYLIQCLCFSNIALLVYYIFWAHWLNWSHEYFVQYVAFGPIFSLIFRNLLLVTVVTFACISANF